MNKQDYSVSVYAYVGDAALEVYIRERLAASGISDTGRLSAMAQKLVCAEAQSDRLQALFPMLTEEENGIYLSARNHKTKTTPKHSTPAQYHRATGFEAIFGFLYLSGDAERAKALFSAAYPDI